jgi:hypothetical protein
MKKDFTEALTNAVDNLARGHERTARIVYDRHVIDTGKRTVTIEFTPERKPTTDERDSFAQRVWGFMRTREPDAVTLPPIDGVTTTNGIGDSWRTHGWIITDSGRDALAKPARFEPKPGEECWILDRGGPFDCYGAPMGLLVIRHEKWCDDRPEFWVALKAGLVFRTRDEAKAELFKRQGEK